MCKIIMTEQEMKKYSQDYRNTSFTRTDSVIAWKVFAYHKLNLLRPLFNHYVYGIENHMFKRGYTEETPNIDNNIYIRLPIVTQNGDLYDWVTHRSGFFSFKNKADAYKYESEFLKYDEYSGRLSHTVRKVLLLDILAEYKSTRGDIYMSKILYIFPEEA